METETALKLIDMVESILGDRERTAHFVWVFLERYGGTQLYIPRSLSTRRGRELLETIESTIPEKPQALKLGQELIAAWGGGQVYLPLAVSTFKPLRDRAVYDAFDGSNHGEVCRRFKISFGTLYRILRKQRKEARP